MDSEILTLEHKSWDALCKSGSSLLPMLSNDCVMVFPAGLKLSARSTPSLSSVLTSEDFVPWSTYAVLDSEIRVLDASGQTALICYRVSAEREDANSGSQAFRASCSSVWRKKSGRWEMVFHQQTPL
ncbi:major facilitator superfamily MFS_1 [Aspergillus terreus]|uniref:Major facilitator superfamily MFS_1 n=1 Tax=Aspergillus terreus TaxID=33178 RepID=A0A5M3ZGT2_ASPTE|nr:hypothetical protein ATETN484_0016003600 [Aspergillus terreus]GFF21465.1 major facilitator superfamily MFS_1 [Aspergillus terreus]